MQKASHRQSLDLVLNKSLKETGYEKSKFLDQPSSFNIMTKKQKKGTLIKSKNNDKSTTFYKLLEENGYIKEAIDMNKQRKREW